MWVFLYPSKEGDYLLFLQKNGRAFVRKISLGEERTEALKGIGSCCSGGGKEVVPKAGFEPAHPGGRQTLNLVRLPFRHFGTWCVRLSSFIEKRSRLGTFHVMGNRLGGSRRGLLIIDVLFLDRSCCVNGVTPQGPAASGS